MRACKKEFAVDESKAEDEDEDDENEGGVAEKDDDDDDEKDDDDVDDGEKERRNLMRKEARSCARFLSRFLFELPRVEETTVRVEVGLGVWEKIRRGRAVMMV